MELQGLRAAVVGGGIGGLAATLALAQHGAAVTLFEQAPAFGDVGAGIQIGPNGVAVLEALGLGPAAQRVAETPQAIELRDHRGARALVRLPLGDAAVARYGRPYWQFHRADLVEVLRAGAVAAGAVLECGRRVKVVPAPPGVRVAGAAFDLAVAADGIRSGVGAGILEVPPARFTGHVAWRALVDADDLPAGLVPDATCVAMGPGRHVVSYPLRRGRVVNLVAVEERAAWADEGWMQAADPAALRQAFATFGEPVATLLRAAREAYLWGLFDHLPLPRWVAGRVALLGDACHPMLPFLAQGAAMALEDAWVLAAELARAPDLGRGLAAYEARRKPRATRMQRAAAGNGRIYHLATPGLRQALHAGLRLASAVAPGALLGRFDWLYGADVTER